MTWDATNVQGKTVASEVYFHRIEADNHFESKKMLLVKYEFAWPDPQQNGHFSDMEVVVSIAGQ